MATFSHLTLAAHPPLLNRVTVSSERVAPRGWSRPALRAWVSSLVTALVGIGRYPNSAVRHFDGTIDEVRILNRALSAEEILSDASAAGHYPGRLGTVGWYHLDENEGSTVGDASGSNNGMVYGASWVAGRGEASVLATNAQTFFDLKVLEIVCRPSPAHPAW